MKLFKTNSSSRIKLIFLQVLQFSLLILIISSCEESISSEHSAKQEVYVEHATLEEINTFMRDHGMEEFTEEDVQRSQKLLRTRTIWPCTTWVEFGDWNHSGTLNTLDLYQCRLYMCNRPEGLCSGPYNLLTIYPDPPLEASNFAFLSDFAGWGNSTTLDEDDIDAGRDLILGIITCS